MGRFYNTNNFVGKFAFAKQPSMDPINVFGMEDATEKDEQDSDIIDTYLKATKQNTQNILNIINIFYDVLLVPDDVRRYDFSDGDNIDDYIYDGLVNYIYREATKEELDTEKGHLFFLSLDDDRSYIEICKDVSCLAAARLSLGLKIYNDLIMDGYCAMTAEL